MIQSLRTKALLLFVRNSIQNVTTPNNRFNGNLFIYTILCYYKNIIINIRIEQNISSFQNDGKYIDNQIQLFENIGFQTRKNQHIGNFLETKILEE